MTPIEGDLGAVARPIGSMPSSALPLRRLGLRLTRLWHSAPQLSPFACTNSVETSDRVFESNTRDGLRLIPREGIATELGCAQARQSWPFTHIACPYRCTLKA